MRGALLPVLVGLLCQPALAQQAQAPQRRPPPPKAAAPQVPAQALPPVIGCPSLANLRRLLRDAKGDQAAARAVLTDDRADHLGCSPVPRDRVERLADHVALGSDAYDCLGLRDTAICQWTLAGAIPLPEPPAVPRGTSRR